MISLTLKQVKNINPSALLKLINRAKKFLKTNETFKKICDEYNVDVDYIDIIPVKFDDIDVSARTNNGIITLNYKLLCDGDFFKDYSYLIHEITHFFQQTLNDHPTQGSDDGDYLSNKYEQEGFQNQVKYIDDMFGNQEANDYVDHLLNHHNIKNKKERENKKKELTKLVNK